MPLIIKKDGRREPYDREKVFAGLKKACEKRPVPLDTLEKRLDRIERELQELSEKEIPSSRIGDAVLGALRELDDVAYLRFASVYLSFENAAELIKEVQRLMASSGGAAGEPPGGTQP